MCNNLINFLGVCPCKIRVLFQNERFTSFYNTKCYRVSFYKIVLTNIVEEEEESDEEFNQEQDAPYWS